MSQTEAIFFDQKTKSRLKTIGILLIVGFIFPILMFRGNDLTFLNVEILGESRVPFGLKFQMIYPLLAGIGLLVIANQKRNLVTAIFIMLLAVLPIIMMADDRDLSKLFSSSSNGGLDFIFDFISVGSIFSFIAIIGGAYSSIFLKQKKIGTYIAMGGVVIFAISLFVKGDLNESIPLIDGIRMIISPEDYFRTFGVHSDEGQILVRLLGAVMFTSMVLKILASYAAFLMINEGENFMTSRKRVISYWIASIVVVVVSFFAVLAFVAADKGGGEAFLAVLLFTLKMVAWIGSLMALLPLALSELLVLIDSGAKFDIPEPIAAAGKKFAKDIKETVSNVSKPVEKKASTENVTSSVSKDAKSAISTTEKVEQKSSTTVSQKTELKPNDTIQKLTDLKKMFDDGLITEEEYNMVKQDLLKNL